MLVIDIPPPAAAAHAVDAAGQWITIITTGIPHVCTERAGNVTHLRRQSRRTCET